MQAVLVSRPIIIESEVLVTKKRRARKVNCYDRKLSIHTMAHQLILMHNKDYFYFLCDHANHILLSI